MLRPLVLGFLAAVVCENLSQDDLNRFSELSQSLAMLNETLEVSSQIKLFDLFQVSDSDVSYVFFQSSEDVGTVLNQNQASQVLATTNFDVNLETFFIIHGWLGECNTAVLSVNLRNYLLTNRSLNVFTVCWTKWSRTEYILATFAIAEVGRLVGDFIAELGANANYPLDNVTIVGHSLGSHVAGHAGTRTNSSIGRIIGLDPAGPLFLESDTSRRLDPSDAKYVQVIHTDATFLGLDYDVGHADFWPNGGYFQPGCLINPVGVCDHYRSIFYYLESLDRDIFLARQCTSYNEFLTGSCGDSPVEVMGGLTPDNSVFGTFYLQTSGISPYGLGEAGLGP